MDKNYELIAKEIEKDFEKVFMNRNMYPPTAPTTNVPIKVTKWLETIKVHFTGPQDLTPTVVVQSEVDKSVPMSKSLKDSTIMIDNVEIAMASTNKELYKFVEAFVSTQEAKILCSSTPPTHQEEVLIENIIDEKEEEEMEEEEKKEEEGEKEQESTLR